jgi:hypothetical protein
MTIIMPEVNHGQAFDINRFRWVSKDRELITTKSALGRDFQPLLYEDPLGVRMCRNILVCGKYRSIVFTNSTYCSMNYTHRTDAGYEITTFGWLFAAIKDSPLDVMDIRLIIEDM